MQHECRITVLDTKVFPSTRRSILRTPSRDPAPAFRREIPFCSSVPLSGTIFTT